MFQKWVVAAATVAALVCVSRPAAAQDFKKEMAAAADKTAAVLNKLEVKEVMIGEFSPRGGTRSNFGPEIRRVMAEELARRGIKVVKKSAYELAGNYGAAKDGDSLETFLRINLQLLDSKTGLPVPQMGDTKVDVKDNPKLAEATGVTVKLDPTGTFEDRNGVIGEAIEKEPEMRKLDDAPEPHVPHAQVGKLKVEILVTDKHDATDPAARELRKDGGQLFVDLKQGEFYRIKLTNTAEYDMAVAVGIDGIDQFAFTNEKMPAGADGKEAPLRDAKGNPLYSHVVVPKGKTVVVRGWFRDLKTVDAFSVTEYAKSAAAELGGNSNVAQIVVQASACWEKDEDRPADEKGTKDGSVGTGRGPGIAVDHAVVQRKIGAVREIVTIRYAKDVAPMPMK